MSNDDYKQFITNYSLDNCKYGNQGYKRVLLQLFGLPGNGKSSFINCCKFVIDGFYKEHTKEGEWEKDSYGGACTKRRIPIKLNDVITMVDNRGLPKLNMYETGEIFAQLANLLPLNEEVVWGRDFNKSVDRLMEEDKKPNYTDFIVPILVHSVKRVIPKQEVDLYKEILKITSDLTGINPIIILTHKSHGGLTAAQTMFNDMGSDKIYAIDNYTVQDHRKMLGKHEEILSFLYQVLKEVDFCMESTKNPIDERKDRMKIIIKYLKKNDDEKRKQIEEIERETAKQEPQRRRGVCSNQ